MCLMQREITSCMHLGMHVHLASFANPHGVSMQCHERETQVGVIISYIIHICQLLQVEHNAMQVYA